MSDCSLLLFKNTIDLLQSSWNSKQRDTTVMCSFLTKNT